MFSASSAIGEVAVEKEEDEGARLNIIELVEIIDFWLTEEANERRIESVRIMLQTKSSCEDGCW